MLNNVSVIFPYRKKGVSFIIVVVVVFVVVVVVAFVMAVAFAFLIDSNKLIN